MDMNVLVTTSQKYMYLKRGFMILMSTFSLIEAIALMKMQPKIILIGIDQNGTRIIGDEGDSLLKSEVSDFIRNFISLYYTYENATYIDQVGKATGFMTQELWKSMEPQIRDVESKIKDNPIQSFSTLVRVFKKDDGSYRAPVFVTVTNRMAKVTRNIEVHFKIKKVPRSEENKWGMEVDSLEEKTI